jgi:hypothetical protein
MCFWFGLEIIRLGYKKMVFFLNIVWFLSYLTFYSQKKVAPQKCAEVLSLAKGGKKCRHFQHFSEKKSLGTS